MGETVLSIYEEHWNEGSLLDMPTNHKDECKNEAPTQFVQQVIIAIIMASLFSYLFGESLTLFHTHWTIKMYELSGPKIMENPLNSIMIGINVFGPIAVVVFADIALFVFLFWELYWIRVSKKPSESIKKILLEVFLLLPISLIPWPIQHIFTLLFLEREYIVMHISYIVLWILLFCGGVVLGKIRFNTWFHEKSN